MAANPPLLNYLTPTLTNQEPQQSNTTSLHDEDLVITSSANNSIALSAINRTEYLLKGQLNDQLSVTSRQNMTWKQPLLSNANTTNFKKKKDSSQRDIGYLNLTKSQYNSTGLFNKLKNSSEMKKISNKTASNMSGMKMFVKTVLNDSASALMEKYRTQNLFHRTTGLPINNRSTNGSSSSNHLNLQILEEELSQKGNSQQDLMLAIAILQHHSLPATPSTQQSKNVFQWNESPVEEEGDLKYELMHSNEASLELDNEASSPTVFDFVNINTDNEDEFTKDITSIREYRPILPNTMFYDQRNENILENGSNKANEMLPDSLYSTTNMDYLPKGMIIDEFLRNRHDTVLHQTSKTDVAADPNYNLVRKSIHSSNAKSSEDKNNYMWMILVMDGDCGIISKRMNTFVMFLKAALSARLDAKYDDILVMSVFCDNTFMVNISLDNSLYGNALSQLQALAEANTTLLEISGEIFYLEKVLTQNSQELLGRLNGKSRAADVELVIYIAVGAVCTFILISVFIVTLISICRHEEDELTEVKTDRNIRPDFPIRKPNVIYSHKFTQELNPEKYRLNPFEEQSNSRASIQDTVQSSAAKTTVVDRSSKLSGGRIQDRKGGFLIQSSSKLQLLEEVQEEDEDEIEDCGVLEGDEDYHDDEEDIEDIGDDDDDDFFIESMTRPLQGGDSNTSRGGPRQHCCHTQHKSPSNFENPCYNR